MCGYILAYMICPFPLVKLTCFWLKRVDNPTFEARQDYADRAFLSLVGIGFILIIHHSIGTNDFMLMLGLIVWKSSPSPLSFLSTPLFLLTVFPHCHGKRGQSPPLHLIHLRNLGPRLLLNRPTLWKILLSIMFSCSTKSKTPPQPSSRLMMTYCLGFAWSPSMLCIVSSLENRLHSSR